MPAENPTAEAEGSSLGLPTVDPDPAGLDSDQAGLDSDRAEVDSDRARLDSDQAELDSDQAEVDPEAAELDPEPAELDPETRARRDAALRQVRKFGDPVLRAAALPVERFDEELAGEVTRMGELMHDALGVGLAATQLGVLHRVLVYKAYVDDPLTALVNPVIEWASEEMESAEEGCLSLPGVHVEVERHAQLRVRGQDETGKQLEIEAEGLEARVIQHEVDHLDGTLIFDRISRQARKEAMRAMREAQAAGDGAPSARREATRDAHESDDGARAARGDGPRDAHESDGH
jgi:peptide deformylase